MIFSQIAYLILAIILLILSTSLGAAIGLFIVLSVLYGSEVNKTKQQIALLLFAFIIAVMIAVIFLTDVNVGIEYSSRLYMIKNSFFLFLEHPLLGIGAGNWKYEAYKFIPLDVLKNYHRLPGLGNHNLYSMVVSELGLVGLILLISSIYMYVMRAIKYNSIFSISAVYILLFYLICAFFYQAVWHYSINFSKLEVVAFCALGVASSNTTIHNIKTNRFLTFCFLIFSLISVFYFYYFYLTSRACDNFNNDKIELATKISGIEKLYSSVFFNSCYHVGNLNYSLGRFFLDEGVLEKSEYYFREAYHNNPYDYNKNMQIAEFMFYGLDRKQESIEIVNKILKYEDIDRANLLLSKYLISKSDYTKASILLAKPSINYSLYPDLLFQEIFEAEYSTLNFDTKFVWDFDSGLSSYQNEFKDLILNHGLNSKEARKLRSSFKVYRNRFETYLKGKVSTENYIKYIEKRYKRYVEYEFLNISTLNKLDTVTLEKIETLIKQYLVDYKLGNSKNSKKVLQDKYLKDLRAIGVDKGYTKNIFNYY
jgi:hypothetical protein